MTQDEIIRNPIGREQLVALAREAGLIQYVQVEKTCVSNALERFAALVAANERNRHAWTQEHWTEYEHAIAAAEREACAKVCEELAKGFNEEADNSRLWCAAAIRARGEK